MTISDKPASREDGFALVTAMILLVVLTVIGIAATQNSMFEIMISGAERRKNEAFYAAEAGLEHGRMLITPLLSANIGAAADPDEQKPKLTFLLDGSLSGMDAASGDDFDGGVKILDGETIGDGYTYTVRIFDNRNDPDDPDTDTNTAVNDPETDGDGLVILSSQASKPNGGISRLEIGLETSISFFKEEDYQQIGGTSDKRHTNTDSDVVDHGTTGGSGDTVGQFQMGAYNHP